MDFNKKHSFHRINKKQPIPTIVLMIGREWVQGVHSFPDCFKKNLVAFLDFPEQMLVPSRVLIPLKNCCLLFSFWLLLLRISGPVTREGDFPSDHKKYNLSFLARRRRRQTLFLSTKSNSPLFLILYDMIQFIFDIYDFQISGFDII